MTTPLSLHPDRLFASEPRQRDVARELHAGIADLPIVSPHGHTDPRWFAEDEPFSDPTSLLVTPDHYLVRMLYSQGVQPEELGVRPRHGGRVAAPRDAWRTFAANYRLFLGTPSRIWLDHALHEVFGVDVCLSAETADAVFDRIDEALADPAFRPRALLDRFDVEVIATTDSAVSDLRHHRQLAADGLAGRVIPTFRPDAIADPDDERFASEIGRLGELTGRDTSRWDDFLAAVFDRRKHAISLGATATDHGPPSAFTAAIDAGTAQGLLDRALAGSLDRDGAELFRGAVLVEMAAMSCEDGLVMQLHPGSRRNHNPQLFERFGRDVGADIPGRIDYVEGLRALLARFGNDPRFRLVAFTLDESTYGRELAPLAGHYPAMYVGAPWWFFDSVEGMLRHKRAVTESAGFANITGFVDDTRAFMSIPARHDVARRVDCRHLAELVTDHRLTIDDAHELANELAVGLNRRVFRLSGAED